MTEARTRSVGMWGSASCVGLLIGCAPDHPDIDYVTDEVQIGNALGVPLCGADLRFLDWQVARVEDAFQAQSDDRITIYVYPDPPAECSDGARGCYVHDRRHPYVVGIWESLDHEIGHAVVDRFAKPSLFWSETAAQALSVSHTEPGPTSVEANVHQKSTGDIDHLTLLHFGRWLIDDLGSPTELRRTLETGSFEKGFGEPFEDAVEMFESDAPWSYPGIDSCDAPPMAPSEGGWREEFQLSCDDDDVSRFGGWGISTHRTVEITEAGPYELHSSAGDAVRVIGCQTSIVAEEPADFRMGDVYSQIGGNRVVAIAFEAGPVHELTLVPGRYLLTITTDEGEATAVELVPAAG